jgi:hypothetical protein
MASKYKANAKDGDGDGKVQDGTKFERKVGEQLDGYKADAVDGDADGLVQDGTDFERVDEPEVVVASVVVEEEPEVVVEVVEEKKVEAPTPAAAAPKGDKAEPKSVPTVLTSDITVSRGKIVFESLYEHNSRSVGVLQIRLLELGYVAAGSDNRGYLSDGTLAAIKEFAGDHGLEANKIDNEQLMKAIFAGTPVTVGT